MCTLIYFSLATIFDKTADALLAFHQEKQSITFRVYSEYFRDYKQTAQRISDIAYIESSGISTRKIHYKNQLTKDWCSSYLSRSLSSMSLQTIFHYSLRSGRVMCFDVVGDRSSALDESRIYGDEFASGTYQIVHDENFDEFYPNVQRYGVYIGLVLSASQNGLYGLCDKLIEKGSLYRDHLGRLYSDMFDDNSPKKIYRSTPKQLAQNKNNCVNYGQNAPTVAYLCFLRGHIKRSSIEHFHVDY